MGCMLLGALLFINSLTRTDAAMRISIPSYDQLFQVRQPRFILSYLLRPLLSVKELQPFFVCFFEKTI